MYDYLIAPFVEYGFMQRALLGSLMLSLSGCPVGVFLMLRRMSLTGDAMAHAILPGAAAGFLLYGLEIIPMTVGGLVAGVIVAMGAGLVSRFTVQKEDASMAAFYLMSLAVGVLIVSIRGSSVDLMHVLFGTVLALNNEALVLIGLIAAVTLALLGIFWRALVAECMDPLFLRSVSRLGTPVHFIFLGLVVLNLVGGFQALGTLLSVGLMMLPAVAARFWTTRVGPMCVLAILIGFGSCVAGLLLSYHASLPSGPSIILSAGAVYCFSIVFGTRGVLNTRAFASTATAPPEISRRRFAMLRLLVTPPDERYNISPVGFAAAHAGPTSSPASIIGDFAKTSAATASDDHDRRPDGTRMSTSRARPTRLRWRRPVWCLSTARISKASCNGWSKPVGTVATIVERQRASRRASSPEFAEEDAAAEPATATSIRTRSSRLPTPGSTSPTSPTHFARPTPVGATAIWPMPPPTRRSSMRSKVT